MQVMEVIIKYQIIIYLAVILYMILHAGKVMLCLYMVQQENYAAGEIVVVAELNT